MKGVRHIARPLFALSLTALTGILCAQVSLETAPVSWSVDNGSTSVMSFLTPGFVDVEQLLLEDAEEAFNAREDALRFAKKQSVDYTTDNSGRWINLPNGDRLWLLGIESPGALSLGLTFGKFNLPKGAALYLYNPERTAVIGALTGDNNHPSKVLTTEKIIGDRLIVEYYEPYAVRHKGEIRIRSVAHTYRHPADWYPEQLCGLPSACQEVLNFVEAGSSVALMTVDDGTRYCTATLVNNANFDGKPYLLVNYNALSGDPNGWHFTFRRSASSCQSSSTARKQFSISGAAVRAIHAPSGMGLIELYVRPLANWKVKYAGWDASGATPQHAAVIHHPLGTLKQVALTGRAPLPVEWGDSKLFRIDGWEYGSTAEGSAGAPLINEQSRVSGLLRSGLSNCGDNQPDFFVTLHTAWASFKSFLDPFDEGILSLPGTYHGFSQLEAQIFEDNVALFPVPARSTIHIVNDNDEPVRFVTVFDLSGRMLGRARYDGSQIDISHLTVGHYIAEIELESTVVRKQFMKWD